MGIELAVVHEASLDFSQGCLEGFLGRHEFVLRKTTNKPTHSDAELADRAAKFIMHLRGLIAEYGIEDSNIYSLDDTALFFDHQKGSTIDNRGATHVPVSHFC